MSISRFIRLFLSSRRYWVWVPRWQELCACPVGGRQVRLRWTPSSGMPRGIWRVPYVLRVLWDKEAVSLGFTRVFLWALGVRSRGIMDGGRAGETTVGA